MGNMLIGIMYTQPLKANSESFVSNAGATCVTLRTLILRLDAVSRLRVPWSYAVKDSFNSIRQSYNKTALLANWYMHKIQLDNISKI